MSNEPPLGFNVDMEKKDDEFERGGDPSPSLLDRGVGSGDNSGNADEELVADVSAFYAAAEAARHLILDMDGSPGAVAICTALASAGCRVLSHLKFLLSVAFMCAVAHDFTTS